MNQQAYTLPIANNIPQMICKEKFLNDKAQFLDGFLINAKILTILKEIKFLSIILSNEAFSYYFLPL